MAGLEFRVHKAGEIPSLKDGYLSLSSALGYDEGRAQSIWNFFYEKNPIGELGAVTVRDGSRIVGCSFLHFSDLEGGDSRIRFALYTAAMLLPSARVGPFTYISMINHLKQLGNQGRARIIIAFPNAMAVQPLTRFGGFRRLHTGYFTRSRVSEGLLESAFAFKEKPLFLSSDHIQWRCSRKGLRQKEGWILKDYEEEVNVLENLGEGAAPSELIHKDVVYPVWDPLEMENRKPISDYRVNMCAFATDENGWEIASRLRPSLLLGDVV